MGRPKIETPESLTYTPTACVQKIALAIESQGLNPTEIDEKLNFARYRIRRWIENSGVPDVYEIGLVAREIDRDIVYLMTDSIPPREPGGPHYRDLTKLVDPADIVPTAGTANGADANRAPHDRGDRNGEPPAKGIRVDYDVLTINRALDQFVSTVEAMDDVLPDIRRLKLLARRAIEDQDAS